MVADFKKEQKGNFFSSDFLFKTLGITLIIMSALLIFADFRIYQKKRHLEREVLNYKNQIEQIQKRNKTLKEEIANYDNSDYIEKIAREEQNMQKPGEKVVSFVWPKDQQKTENQKIENFGLNFTGWLSECWSWLKSKF